MSANDEYRIWSSVPIEDNCVLQTLVGFDKTWKLTSGMSLADQWPDDVVYHMNADLPHNTILTDSLLNSRNVIVASQKLRALLEEEGVAGVEFLPVTVIDHKGNPIEPKYWLANLIDAVDCIDTDASDLEWSDVAPSKLSRIRRLVIDADRVPKERRLFRVARTRKVMMATTELAETISSAGLTGIAWRTIDTFKG